MLGKPQSEAREYGNAHGQIEREAAWTRTVCHSHEVALRGAKLTVSTSPAGTEIELRVPPSVVFAASAARSKRTFQKLKSLF
jgi:hypothetical protein